MKLIDMHCDTITELFKAKENFYKNNRHISIEKARNFEKYIQVCAVWSDKALSDEEAFSRFSEIMLKKETWSGNGFDSIRTKEELAEAVKSRKHGFILSVEDGRLLAGDISRLEFLRSYGVKFLTPVWSGTNCLGGAYDTDAGLTDFGREVIKTCFSMNIIPDISHASVQLADEVFSIAENAGIPPVATHSNSYSVCCHPRNLTDAQFLRLKELGGIVGISLAPFHLRDSSSGDFSMRHISSERLSSDQLSSDQLSSERLSSERLSQKNSSQEGSFQKTYSQESFSQSDSFQRTSSKRSSFTEDYPQSIFAPASSDDIIRHIEHYFSLGGEKNVVLGCDFDGIDETPSDISDISDLSFLYSKLSSVFGKDNADNIFFNNAYNFLIKYMI